MTSCKNHPDRDAQTVCSGCGADLCEECVAPSEGEPLCFDCSIAAAEQEVAKKQVAAAPTPVQKAPPSRFSVMTRVILTVGIVIVAAELAIIVLMRPQEPSRFAPSGLDPRQTATATTGADVILITEGLEEHHREKGEYPQDLAAISDFLPPELLARLDDPSTVYELDGRGGYRIRFQGNGPQPVSMDTEVRAPMVEGVEP